MKSGTIVGIAAAAAVSTALVVSVTSAPAAHNTAGVRAESSVERYYVSEVWHAISVKRPGQGQPTDVYAFQDELKTEAGKAAGTANGYAVNLRAPFVGWRATANLPAGTLSMSADYDNARAPHVLVISGGTGRYFGARGTVTLTDAGKRGDLAVVTFER